MPHFVEDCSAELGMKHEADGQKQPAHGVFLFYALNAV